MMRLVKSFLAALLLGSSVRADSVTKADFDADYYFYYGSYNSLRNPLFVGVNNLTGGSPYQYHFNFATVKFNLDGLLQNRASYLQLNLMRFRIPGPVVPNSAPSYTYSTNGYNFDLKIVALGADFSELEQLSAADLPNWYSTNLLNRPELGIMRFNSAGTASMDVSATVEEWLANPARNFGFGLVGIPTQGGTEGLTAQFYSTEFTNNPSLAPSLVQASGQTPLQSWMAENGFSGDSSLGEDTDADGLTNLMEFFLNRNPRIADSSGSVSGKIENGQLRIQFFRRAGENLGVLWEVRTSDSLSLPIESWTTNSVSIAQGIETNGSILCSGSVPVTNTKPKQFLRLVLRASP